MFYRREGLYLYGTNHHLASICGGGAFICLSLLFAALSILFIVYNRSLCCTVKGQTSVYGTDKIDNAAYDLFFTRFFACFLCAWIGQTFVAYKDLIRMLGAVLLIFMGLFLIGIIQPTWLMQEKKWDVSKQGFGYLSSVLIGVSFAAGWTPCLGPILASVLAMITIKGQLLTGFVYITMYVLGFAIPFLLMAFFIGRTKTLLRYSNQVMKIGGGLLIVFGILLYTDQLTTIIAWMTNITGGFTGF
jgi:cytochrome c biogenesis protein CcdA